MKSKSMIYFSKIYEVKNLWGITFHVPGAGCRVHAFTPLRSHGWASRSHVSRFHVPAQSFLDYYDFHNNSLIIMNCIDFWLDFGTRRDATHNCSDFQIYSTCPHNSDHQLVLTYINTNWYVILVWLPQDNTQVLRYLTVSTGLLLYVTSVR